MLADKLQAKTNRHQGLAERTQAYRNTEEGAGMGHERSTIDGTCAENRTASKPPEDRSYL